MGSFVSVRQINRPRRALAAGSYVCTPQIAQAECQREIILTTLHVQQNVLGATWPLLQSRAWMGRAVRQMADHNLNCRRPQLPLMELFTSIFLVPDTGRQNSCLSNEREKGGREGRERRVRQERRKR